MRLEHSRPGRLRKDGMQFGLHFWSGRGDITRRSSREVSNPDGFGDRNVRNFWFRGKCGLRGFNRRKRNPRECETRFLWRLFDRRWHGNWSGNTLRFGGRRGLRGFNRRKRNPRERETRFLWRLFDRGWRGNWGGHTLRNGGRHGLRGFNRRKRNPRECETRFLWRLFDRGWHGYWSGHTLRNGGRRGSLRRPNRWRCNRCESGTRFLGQLFES